MATNPNKPAGLAAAIAQMKGELDKASERGSDLLDTLSAHHGPEVADAARISVELMRVLLGQTMMLRMSGVSDTDAKAAIERVQELHHDATAHLMASAMMLVAYRKGVPYSALSVDRGEAEAIQAILGRLEEQEMELQVSAIKLTTKGAL